MGRLSLVVSVGPVIATNLYGEEEGRRGRTREMRHERTWPNGLAEGGGRGHVPKNARSLKQQEKARTP